MRMLLTSGGLENELVRNTLIDLMDKPVAESRIVVVIDAMLPFGGDRTLMLAHLSELQALGWGEFNVLSLFGGPRSVIESRLRAADVIFCYGGTNHWLAHAWVANGFAPLLRELLDEKVYVGWSAGSMIFSRLHAAAVQAFDDQDEVEMLQLDSVAAAVPLFDWFVLPHLGAPFAADQTPEWAAERAPRLGGALWFIDDDSALLVRDADAEPEIVSTGHWLRFDADGQLVDSR